MKQQKKLVVYYSRNGTTRKAAEALAAMLKCDVEELTDNVNRQGLAGYLRCGKEGMKKTLARINATKKNPADYDLVIIGTPIWAGNMSSPIRAFLSSNKGKIKEAAFFCTMGGENTGQTFADMESLSKKPVATLAVRTREVKKDEHLSKLKEFAGKLKK
jgi:flavodoxin